MYLVQGVSGLGGVSGPGGHVWSWGGMSGPGGGCLLVRYPPPPPLTDRCKNINLATTPLWPVINTLLAASVTSKSTVSQSVVSVNFVTVEFSLPWVKQIEFRGRYKLRNISLKTYLF